MRNKLLVASLVAAGYSALRARGTISRLEASHSAAILKIGSRLADAAVLCRTFNLHVADDGGIPEGFRLQWASEKGVGDATLKEFLSYVEEEIVEVCREECRTLIEFEESEI